MIEFRIQTDDEESIERIKFSLFRNSDGDIVVQARTDDGHRFDILRFSPGQDVYRYKNVPKSLKLPVNLEGQVLIQHLI